MKEYFSHDYNTRSDEKIKNLIRKCGYSGYGVFWAIIEDLYNNANALRLDCEGIAYDYRVDENTVRSIIFDFDLFDYNDEFFWSNSVQKRLDMRNEKSEKAKKSAESRWKKGNNNANALNIDANALRSECDSNAIKEKKRKEKEKESKVNNKKDIREESASFDASPTNSNSEIEFVEYEEIQSVETTSVAIFEKPEKVARAKKFDFKGALLSVGICEEYANAWMEVRKSKKATNSEQAFNILCKEFSKAFYASGMSTNECAEWAIKRDWRGFDYKWVENDLNKNNNGFKTKRQQHEEGLLRLAEDVRISAERARNLTREEELKRYEDVPF